jgi:hypothetical protein
LAKVLRVLDIGPFEFFYIMHLLDREGEKLGLRREVAEQSLPPLVLSGGGLLSGETDEAFQRVFREVLALYQHIFRERLMGLAHERKGE